MNIIFLIEAFFHLVELGENLFGRIPCFLKDTFRLPPGFYICLFQPHFEFSLQPCGLFGVFLRFPQFDALAVSVLFQQNTHLFQLLNGCFKTGILRADAVSCIFNYFVGEPEAL